MCIGQNLILNPGFDEIDSCYFFGENFRTMPHWFVPNEASPDRFNSCSFYNQYRTPKNHQGFQYPRSGDGYVGFAFPHNPYKNFFEYVSQKLAKPLIKNYRYEVSFYVSLGGLGWGGVNKVGAMFCIDEPSSEMFDKISGNAQVESDENLIITDTTNWTLVTGEFIASGGERYITIGQFNKVSDLLIEPNNNAKESYCFLEDVSMFELGPMPILQIRLQIPNVFTPNEDGNNDQFFIDVENIESGSISIRNRWGQEVFSTSNIHDAWDGTHNGNLVAEGVYFVVVVAKTVYGEVRTEKELIHLFR